MEDIASALGDAARWQIVELLATRPRSVGELAELTGLRQPQTTKHLQTLARVGLVAVHPLGQRRVYAIEPGPLADFASRVRALVEIAEAHQGELDVIARYRAAIEVETVAADQDRWADGRTFSFERALAAPPDVVWRHWVDPALLGSWWAPPPMTVSECVLEPKPGGQAVLEYRDADGRYRSEGRVRTAVPLEHLEFTLSVLNETGVVSFTGHYDIHLAPTPEGTQLRVDLRITDSTVESAPYIAGIGTGWAQVLDQLVHAINASH
ncbi:metalloregulator ArsR/SmtB family transcription factor [Actinokineospora auranticolor]|uniref:Uncharacterized protein YndB with AHSA1/START domain n=1 Tax=Actinokineospora auranticolor TaxID=155976 RepID=A0A2S6GVC7_9PSEU|nr:metalloregulator ArsR/SmtB family transcription factor [Actinokineospora auranticolor]PPK69153.1 uncharacterized protein YndB with AHSA1/START domain [Actinokineospora auranticolor]